MSQGAENGLCATPIFILEELKDFDWNGVGRGNHYILIFSPEIRWKSPNYDHRPSEMMILINDNV